MKGKYVVLILVIIVAGFMGYAFYAKHDDVAIRQQFAALATNINKAADEPPLLALQKAKTIGNFFTDPCYLEIKALSFKGSYKRQEIAERAAMARAAFADIAFDFYDLRLKIEGETTQAIVTGRLTGKTTGGNATDETHEVEAILQKKEGVWLLSKAVIIQVLEKQK